MREFYIDVASAVCVEILNLITELRCVPKLSILVLDCNALKIWMAPKTDYTNKNKLHGLSPPANYTDRATATCRRSDCQLLLIKCAMWSA
jgi:hypothetical protein